MPFERHPDARPENEVEVSTLEDMTAFKADTLTGSWIHGLLVEHLPSGKVRVLLEQAGRGVLEAVWLASVRVEPIGKAKSNTAIMLPANITPANVVDSEDLPNRPTSSDETLTGHIGFTFFDSVAAHAAFDRIIKEDWHFAEHSNSSSSIVPRNTKWYVRFESRDIFDEKYFFDWIKELQEFMAEQGGLLTFFSLIMTREQKTEPEEAEILSNVEDIERED